jgi:hypothetical protein
MKVNESSPPPKIASILERSILSPVVKSWIPSRSPDAIESSTER